MNKLLLKKIITLFITIFLVTNVFIIRTNSSAEIDESSIERKKLSESSQIKTYIDLKKDPSYVHNGDIVVVGDSFAYLFAANCGKKINYVVHQGYNIDLINNELMNLIPNLRFRHCFLFIGPNDYMEQTDLFKFQVSLQEVFNKAHDRNMDVIVTNYFEPDHNHELAKALVFCPIPCSFYEYIIKDTAERNGITFMDISDLLAKYGHDNGDFIHPKKEINKEILSRLLSRIH